MIQNKIWAVIQWILAAIILLFAIVAFATSGGIISGLLFVLLAIVVSPLRKKIFSLLPANFQKKSIAIISGVVLAIASLFSFPSAETSQLSESPADEVQERSIPISEDVVETPTEQESNIKSLSFSNSSDIEVLEGKEVSSSYVKANVKDKNSFTESDVIFVSDDPQIATIEYKSTALTNYLYYTVTGVSAGETEIYAISKDGSIESEHKKVTVKVDEEKLAREKAEAEKAEAEKKAAEEAEKKAEEERLAKEKAEAEEKLAKEKAEAEEKAAEEAKAAETAATITDSATETQVGSASGTKSGGNSGGGNADNFDTYDIPEQQNTEASYVLNMSSMKFHYPSCKDVKKIKPENYGTSSSSRDELMSQGYSPCGHCNP